MATLQDFAEPFGNSISSGGGGEETNASLVLEGSKINGDVG